MKIKKRYVFIGVITLIILSLIYFYKKKGSETGYVTEKATKGNLAKTVSATGNLIGEEEIDLNFEITGRIEGIQVQEGDEVATGEILAVMEDDVLNSEVEKAKYALDKAVADAGSNDDVIREAKQTVTNAEEYLDDVKNLEEQKVDAAKEEYSRAKEYYEDAEDYYNKVKDENGSDSSTTKSAKLTLTTAYNQMNAAQEAWQTAQETEDLNKTSAENSLNTAKEQLKTAESNYAKLSRDSVVAQARANYEIALANLSKATLKAPVNGKVVKINYDKGEVFGSSASVSTFGTLMSKDYLLEADVPESDIAQLKVGQKADVTFDSLTLKDVFNAAIIEIEPAATVIQDVVYYKVKLKLDNFDPRLKPGMSADIDIKVEEKLGVVMIPERSVIEDNGGEKVRILLSDGQIKEVTIKTGISGDDGMIEVISGLNGDEEIVVLEKETEE